MTLSANLLILPFVQCLVVIRACLVTLLAAIALVFMPTATALAAHGCCAEPSAIVAGNHSSHMTVADHSGMQHEMADATGHDMSGLGMSVMSADCENACSVTSVPAYIQVAPPTVPALAVREGRSSLIHDRVLSSAQAIITPPPRAA